MINSIKPKTVLVLLIFVFLFSLTSCNKIDKPDEITGKTDKYEDLGLEAPSIANQNKHNINGESPFEWWYFDGHLDTGETFVGVIHNPNYINGKPSVALSLYSKDWKRKKYNKILAPEDMKVSADNLDISCPAGYVRRLDDKTYLAGWNIDDIKIDVKLTTLAQGWRPGGNGFDTTSEASKVDFFWAIHQAKNKIEGTITENGITRKITGIGYADHNWGRKKLNKVANSWIWGRIFADDYTIVYAHVNYSDPSIPSLVLYVAKDGKMIIGTRSPVIKQCDFATHPVLKRHYPQQISIDFSHEGQEVHLKIKNKTLAEEKDLIDELDKSSIVKWLVKTFITRPSYFRLIADYEGTITYKGKTTPIKGECLYEAMVLK